MELRDNAYVALAAMILLIILGIVTGSGILFAAFAVVALIFAADYCRIRLMARQIRRELIIIKSLSERTASPGSPVILTIKLMFSQGRPLTLLVSQPLDNTIASEPLDERVWLSRHMIKESYLNLTPMKYGDHTLGPLKLVAVALLFRKTVFLGNEETLRVRPKISQASAGLEEIVKEYGSEREVPAFLLVDTDSSSLDRAIEVGTGLAGTLYADREKPGLLCFSRSGVARLVATGEHHAEAFQDVLANIKPDHDQITGNRPASRSLQDLYEEGVIFDNAAGHAALQPIFEKTLTEYAANIGDDGFSRAISQVVQTTGAPCDLIVVTNLSMGLASLLNGIRLASFHACSTSVILLPRMWPEDDELMDKEKRYHEHAELEEAIVKLKAGAIKVYRYSPETGTD